MKTTAVTLKLIASGILAWISARLGILFPVLLILLICMVIDYVTGMLASKVESIQHPQDPSYGWSSKKGSIGIAKKIAYLCVIAVAMMIDYILLSVAVTIGIQIPNIKAFFGLLTAVWYILNEILSIIENAGRMGADIPDWLRRHIAILKDKIDDTAEKHEIE